jgi:hypothetical protein
MSDMLDIVHFFFEEDSRYGSQEEVESVSAVRSQIYETLYGVPYAYKVKSGGKTRSTTTSDIPDVDEVKPYIPPTEFDPGSSNPFGAVLEAPLR